MFLRDLKMIDFLTIVKPYKSIQIQEKIKKRKSQI